ncbi:hypothetical protein [Mesorhizobium sp. WSM3866]|uniref:hypothetical protein n=1 Tax=Mesorhizobium sp. WSM3866 TaxID=422271 RepID=UPI0015968FE7|nr:hypothetical protein [Mesorhizobium sp. WSM3866]
MPNESTRLTEMNPEKLIFRGRGAPGIFEEGRAFAAMTPPAITVLLGTSLNSKAIAKS